MRVALVGMTDPQSQHGRASNPPHAHSLPARRASAGAPPCNTHTDTRFDRRYDAGRIVCAVVRAALGNQRRYCDGHGRPRLWHRRAVLIPSVFLQRGMGPCGATARYAGLDSRLFARQSDRADRGRCSDIHRPRAGGLAAQRGYGGRGAGVGASAVVPTIHHQCRPHRHRRPVVLALRRATAAAERRLCRRRFIVYCTHHPRA